MKRNLLSLFALVLTISVFECSAQDAANEAYMRPCWELNSNLRSLSGQVILRSEWIRIRDTIAERIARENRDYDFHVCGDWRNQSTGLDSAFCDATVRSRQCWQAARTALDKIFVTDHHHGYTLTPKTNVNSSDRSVTRNETRGLQVHINHRAQRN